MAAISSTTALLSALAFTIAYVAPFYLSAILRTSSLHDRDAPVVIQARVRAVLISCTISTITTLILLTQLASLSPSQILHHLGLYPASLPSIPSTLLLCATLFIAPLYEQLYIDRAYTHYTLTNLTTTIWHDWTGYRNLLIAPLTEELVFRSLIISLFLTANSPLSTLIFGTPLIFGVAHIHHLIDFLRSRTAPGQTFPASMVVVQGVIRSVVQFTYTSLFGFFAAFVFLRTGSLWCAVAAHMFCNWQGVPRVYGRVGQSGRFEDVTPDVAQGKDVGGGGRGRAKEMELVWTGIYYALLFVGMLGFYLLLWPLTESANALVQL